MNIIIGNAWPYANGPLHLGRIAVLLPGDIIARYHRLMGDDVIFLSGTDCHGTPVTTKAEQESITPIQAVEKYHENFKKCFKLLDFSFDMFEKTHSEYHQEKVKEFILQLDKEGYIYEEENHLMFKLSEFEENEKEMLENAEGWRENSKIILKRYLDEGLRDRAVTRDFNWGVDVPFKGYEDKKIYVWIEAVMGYLTASMKYCEANNEEWKEYWSGEDSRIYFVHGKDNIPFHSVILPAITKGLGLNNENYRMISSEYMKLEGKAFSTLKNWALWVDEVLKKYDVDTLRYYLILNSPEKEDTDFTWRNYINVNNNDLVDNLNYFVTNTINFSRKNYGSRMIIDEFDEVLKNEILDLYFDVGDAIEVGELKLALNNIFNFIKKYKKEIKESNLWELSEKKPKECKRIVYNYIQIIANLSNLVEPFMPKTSLKIKKALNIKNNMWSLIEKKDGTLKEIDILFEKIDKKKAFEELDNLKKNKI